MIICVFRTVTEGRLRDHVWVTAGGGFGRAPWRSLQPLRTCCIYGAVNYWFVGIGCFVGLRRRSGNLVGARVSVDCHLDMILPSTFCHRLTCRLSISDY